MANITRWVLKASAKLMDESLGASVSSGFGELLQLFARDSGGSWCKVRYESSVYYSRQPAARKVSPSLTSLPGECNVCEP